MFSPKTSPVLSAEIRSSNSFFSAVLFGELEDPLDEYPLEETEWALFIRLALLFFRSRVRIRICKIGKSSNSMSK